MWVFHVKRWWIGSELDRNYPHVGVRREVSLLLLASVLSSWLGVAVPVVEILGADRLDA